MTFGPSANFYVRVRPAAWEETHGEPALFAGIFHVDLHFLVGIVFVSDLSEVAIRARCSTSRRPSSTATSASWTR